MKKSINQISILLFFVFILSSCTSFKYGWNYPDLKIAESDTEQLIKEADQLEKKAASTDELKALIAAYKKVLDTDPQNYFALWKIGNYHILMGAAHTTKIKDKKFHYREAIKYCEKAMYTNDDFKNEIRSGKSIVDACKVLSIDEIDAMGYWYTARFYYFKDCLKPMGRMFNTKIVIQNNEVIKCIDKLNPDWAGGGNYFSRALYYIAVPEKFGGSKEKAEEEFAAAVNAGPDYLVNRWGRAKYLYDLIGDEAHFVSDLEWVISHDPHKAGNSYPWNVYFQKDAKKMLEASGYN